MHCSQCIALSLDVEIILQGFFLMCFTDVTRLAHPIHGEYTI